jgi:hypothetical protein
LTDLGSVKVSARAHCYLSARADIKQLNVVALVRNLIEQYVDDELHISSLAVDRFSAKEAPEIRSNSQRLGKRGSA